MFAKLEENLRNISDTKSALIDWQKYNSADQIPLIVVIVTPLMQRIHLMVNFNCFNHCVCLAVSVCVCLFACACLCLSV